MLNACGSFCSGRPTACEMQLNDMKHASHVRFVMAILAAVALIPLRTSATSPSIVFSEVNWGGSSLSQADEWIELTNISDETISLAGWTIEGAATSNGSITLPELSIPPHSSFLLSNYAESSSSSTLANVPSYVTTSISLSNSALSLILRDASGALVDSVGDGASPPAGQSTEPHSSMQRIDPSLDGSLDATWLSATDHVGFDSGFEHYGSPGVSLWWIVPAPTVAAESTMPVEFVAGEELAIVSEPFSESTTTSVVESTLEQVVATDVLPAETVLFLDEEIVQESIIDNEVILVAPDPDPVLSDPTPETPDIMPEVLVEDETPVATIQEQIISPEESAEVAVQPSVETVVIEEVMTMTTDEPAAAIPDSVDYSSTLQISALLPSPANGESEWVEITNISNETVALVGWTLREGSGKITTIPEGDLAANASLVMSPIKGNLNNGGDTVELLSPDGLVQDMVMYEGDLVPGTGETLKRGDEGWAVMSETINETVTITQTTEVIETKAIVAEPITSEGEIETVVISESIITTTDTEVTPPDFSMVRLSELYPNTNNSDVTEEFVEIKNSSTTSILLTGLFLLDSSGKIFDLSAQTIPASSTLSLARTATNIVLNNDRETISLQTSSGITIDSVSYENAPKGSTLVRTNNEWTWSQLPSTAQPDIVSSDEKRTSSTAGTGTSARAATRRANGSRVDAVLTLTAQQILETADETRVRFSGFVAISPGVSGRQIFYASDETGTIQVYKNDAVFPDLQVGDEITLTGTLSTAQGEKRIKIMKTDALTVTGHEETTTPIVQAIETLTDENVGDVVAVSGTVRVVDNGEMTLEDGANTIVVKLPTGSSVISSALVPGTNVSIAGLLTKSDAGYRLLARSSGDIRIASISTPTEGTTGQEIQAASDSRIARSLGLVVLLILLAGAAREFYPRIKHWYAKRSIIRHASQAVR